MAEMPTAHALWRQAVEEAPDRVLARYNELLREHGHIVKRESGQSVNLPCGWPHRPEPEDVDGA